MSTSSKSDADILEKKGAEFLQGDILDAESLCEFSKGVDCMIHLAAISDVNESVKDPETAKNVNVDGTANVLSCCVANKIKK